MRRVFKCTMAVLLGLAVTTRADDVAEARDVIQRNVDAVLTALRDRSLSEAERRAKVIETVTPYFDYGLMAKLTLGRTHWQQFSAEQQQAFTDLFVRQLQETYLDKVDLHADENVRVLEGERDKSRIVVHTEVVGRDDKFEVVYKLRSADNVWKIYDVTIEGVSVIATYRSQYEDFLKSKSPDELLLAMRERAVAE